MAKGDGYYSGKDIRNDGLLRISKLRERDALTRPKSYQKGERVISTAFYEIDCKGRAFAGTVVGLSRDKKCVRIRRDNTVDPIVVHPKYIRRER